MSLGKITKVTLFNAVRKPATRLEPREPFAATRGHIVYNEETCTFCTLCQRKCPPGAITVDRANRVWQIDHLKCIICGACVLVCNPKSLAMDTHPAPATPEKRVERHQRPAQPPKGDAAAGA